MASRRCMLSIWVLVAAAGMALLPTGGHAFSHRGTTATTVGRLGGGISQGASSRARARALHGLHRQRRAAPRAMAAASAASVAEPEAETNRPRWHGVLPFGGDKLDKEILGTALPSIANLAVIPLVGAVDTFWIGRMGDALALAGQGAGEGVRGAA